MAREGDCGARERVRNTREREEYERKGSAMQSTGVGAGGHLVLAVDDQLAPVKVIEVVRDKGEELVDLRHEAGIERGSRHGSMEARSG